MNQLIYNKIALLVLTLFSQINCQTCPLIMEFMHLYTEIVTIKLFMQGLIFILRTRSLPPPHPPPYQRLIWYYKKANTSNIRKVLDLANCEKRFSHNNINAQVTVFNEIFNEIFSETTQQINISLVMTKILYG